MLACTQRRRHHIELNRRRNGDDDGLNLLIVDQLLPRIVDGRNTQPLPRPRRFLTILPGNRHDLDGWNRLKRRRMDLGAEPGPDDSNAEFRHTTLRPRRYQSRMTGSGNGMINFDRNPLLRNLRGIVSPKCHANTSAYSG